MRTACLMLLAFAAAADCAPAPLARRQPAKPVVYHRWWDHGLEVVTLSPGGAYREDWHDAATGRVYRVVEGTWWREDCGVGYHAARTLLDDGRVWETSFTATLRRREGCLWLGEWRYVPRK